jgi:RNA polymerase sigma factor (sigma-70 family)
MNVTPDDMTLVREFAARQSEPAFATLVERYVALVYSTALRRTGDAQLAEETTQVVFIILARKAATLSRDTILPAWLYRTTRYAAGNALTMQRRRREREQEAYMQSVFQSENTDHVWHQLAPLLENAMDALSERDRAALVLRYFENRSWREVAHLTQVTEDAAQKRAARALEKLRKLFAKRGVALTTTLIAGAVSAKSVHAAPAGMVKAISAITAAKGATAATSATLVKGAMKLMMWTKIKTAVAVGGVLLLGGSAVLVKQSYFPVEPSYQGRKLSEWLMDVDYSQPQEKRKQAGEAIRHMGKKTLPFLMATFSDQKSTDPKLSQTTWAFDALGPIAKSAIPKLEKLQDKYPGYVPSALAGIGPDALPVLLKSLTNDNFFVRDNTAGALANALFSQKISSDAAKDALPIALSNLEYTNANPMFQVNTRYRAASLVGALHREPDESVPALVKCMEESLDKGQFTVAGECASALGSLNAQAALPSMIRCLDKTSEPTTNISVISCATDCTIALGRFGKDAQTAIPVLTKAANSTNAVLSQFATMSLKRIQ